MISFLENHRWLSRHCHLVLIILVPSRITSFIPPRTPNPPGNVAITFLFHILYLVGLVRDKPFYVFDVGRNTKHAQMAWYVFSHSTLAPIVAYPKLQEYGITATLGTIAVAILVVRSDHSPPPAILYFLIVVAIPNKQPIHGTRLTALRKEPSIRS